MHKAKNRILLIYFYTVIKGSHGAKYKIKYCLMCPLSAYWDYNLRQLEYANVHILQPLRAVYNMSDKTDPSKSRFSTH